MKKISECTICTTNWKTSVSTAKHIHQKDHQDSVRAFALWKAERESVIIIMKSMKIQEKHAEQHVTLSHASDSSTLISNAEKYEIIFKIIKKQKKKNK